jgi:MFS transporter, ACS family, hexuronate transporter
MENQYIDETASDFDTGKAIRYGLIALIFFGTALNYLDRQVLSLLKPTLEAEFGWDNRHFGHFASVFQIATAVSLLGIGWFIDRFGVRRGYAIAVIVWSFAGLAHGFATSIQQFVAARITLAVAEAANTPAAMKAAATYLPVRERSVGIGVINSASNIGAIVAPLTVPLIAVSFGWKAAFWITGGLGFLWLGFWWVGTRNLPQYRDAVSASGSPLKGAIWGELLRDRRTWAVAGAKVPTDMIWWFMLFWAPDFFKLQFHLDQSQVGNPTAIVFAMAALGAITSGFLFPTLLARGINVNRARKGSMLFYALLIVPIPLALIAPNQWVAALIIGMGLFAHQGFSTNVFGITADIVPARQVASVIAIGALAGNLAGAAMQEFTGWALDSGFGYTPMFVMAASAYLVALLWIHIMQPKLEMVNNAM